VQRDGAGRAGGNRGGRVCRLAVVDRRRVTGNGIRRATDRRARRRDRHRKVHHADGLNRPVHEVIAVEALRRSRQHRVVRVCGRGKAQHRRTDHTGRDPDATNTATKKSENSIHVVSHALGCPTPAAILTKVLSRAVHGLFALVERHATFCATRFPMCSSRSRCCASPRRPASIYTSIWTSKPRLRRTPLTNSVVGSCDRGKVSAEGRRNADPTRPRADDAPRCSKPRIGGALDQRF